MNTSKKEYQQLTKEISTENPILKNIIWAFCVGGLICTLGQLAINIYIGMGIDEKSAKVWASMTIILLGALLTTFNIFDNIAKHAGAGTLLPITGFANSIVSAAIEFKSEGYITGVGVKIFTIAGPVIIYGTIASIIYGMIVWFFHLY